MKLSEIKNQLNTMQEVVFKFENGEKVPAHFHITEIGQINKKFIDCGGKIRFEDKVSFQLWTSSDTDHRLQAEKLLNIIAISEKILGIQDLEVEVEYQSNTIGKYTLASDGNAFVLKSTATACLASDHCGIPQEKKKVTLATLQTEEASSCCTPGGGCC